MDEYEAIPYQSAPVPETHPERMAILGRLHGLDTPDPYRARILELGCANGSNLIPLAYYLPASRCLGLDLSRAQIDQARAVAGAVPLDNVRFEVADLAHPPADLGEFDYVIAHGLYSWVPAPVREAVLALLDRCLAPNGVAYLSFNTSPGWHLRRVLREALLFHARGRSDPLARLAAAQEMLGRLADTLPGQDGPAFQELGKLVADVRAASPAYWYHEYLAPVNDPIPFADFAEAAARFGLQFLCEATPLDVHSAGLGEDVTGWLATLPDRVAREQYLDFLQLRPFRRTLLCRAGPVLHPEPRAPLLQALWASAYVAPERGKVDLRSSRPARFIRGDSAAGLTVSHPLTRAALAYLGELYPAGVPVPELVARARTTVLSLGQRELADQTARLEDDLLRLFLGRAVQLHLAAPALRFQLPERPRLHRLARAQADAGFDHLAASRHAPLVLDAFGQRLAALLDGARTREQVLAVLAEDVSADRLVLPAGKAAGEKPKQLLARHYDLGLLKLARGGLLEPVEAGQAG